MVAEVTFLRHTVKAINAHLWKTSELAGLTVPNDLVHRESTSKHHIS